MLLSLPNLEIALFPATLLLGQPWEAVLAAGQAAVHPADLWVPQELPKPLSVAEVRDLRRFASRSAVGESKLALLPQAELWRAEVSNGLLKLLEEPPAGFFALILADSVGSLLPTVRSRVQVLAVAPGSATIESSKRQVWQSELRRFNLGSPAERRTAQSLLYLYPLVHSGLKDETILQGFKATP